MKSFSALIISILVSTTVALKDRLEATLNYFDYSFDDIVIEDGENWVDKYYIKQLKKCDLTLPDEKVIDIKALAKNAPPDYTFIDEKGFKYFFNVCRNTHMTCQGWDDGIAVQYGQDGKCVGVLGRAPSSVSYLESEDKAKGFQVKYIQGDFCGDFMKYREAHFDFYCDQSVDIEVRSLIEEQCTYNFKIYTKHACHLLLMASGQAEESPNLLGYDGHIISSAFGFYKSIIQATVGFIVSVIYYGLLIFILYSLYRVGHSYLYGDFKEDKVTHYATRFKNFVLSKFREAN
ncbi:hypothetical protein FGO68_gene15890 [Halteria grandinella]|uniref:MRH domain-containing protein n=1 Tax=Halteria grandinella TaxID=5974 RepID=A0A8J8NJY0_HALGN|nr:hypothetical protein FGO68_gene15890 [Halteria grandinella]